MKKFKLLLIVFAAVLLSGCYRYEAKMVITDDKKVNFEVIYAMINMNSVEDDTPLLTTDNPITTGENDEEDGSMNLAPNCTELQSKLGETWKVESWSDDSYAGCKISKTYENIDEISSDKEVVVELTNVPDGDFDDSKLFTKKGDNYSAHFTFDSSDGYDATEMKDYESMFKLSYSVELPFKNLSNNATTVENDGKKLTWTIKPGVKTDIKYEFNFTGKKPLPWLYIGIGCGAVVLVVVVILIVKSCKKPKEVVAQ